MPKDHDSRPETESLDRNTPSQPMPERPPDTQDVRLSEDWQLIVTIGDDIERLPVEPTLNIGRMSAIGPDIALDLGAYGATQYGVSRHHATISLHDGLLYLEDLDSTNGTRINGFQLTPYHKYCLRDGDEIEFGRLRVFIRFEKPK